ncbi:ATP-dependent zinc metalloprotease FtsH [Entomospira culicis]|uniref:ATP-dependent zinc metalloprotease FtsH n=1 Tax=Entomospira culicis TaxID=2719989 RepID=A0A968GFQ0_9SPIO|nr:ATP-dependent zinc metalloprotease FtsH [Entomospira culicis]NIZ19349.1 ATP-dependent zinc metalloprotease FtsH [Entomospira culicis]NIZ69746.1 ATP-dependent zinc metalloprotease FtsH [Entomospira culicis]WDI36857.1 ATP-dependent zinc metalloprotease FtsH [Entomospira culicis]WDI38486.1 ATP-dependent zinc metalloprotease FtsH [Entomospira culicis]
MADKNNNNRKPPRKDNRPNPIKPSSGKFNFGLLIIIVLALLLIANWFGSGMTQYQKISLSSFKEKITNQEIKGVQFKNGFIIGFTQTQKEMENQALDKHKIIRGMTTMRQLQDNKQEENPTYRAATLVLTGIQDPELLQLIQSNNLEVEVIPPSNNYFLNQILPFLILFGILILLSRSMFKRMGGGANALNFGQNKGRIVAEQDLKTTFADVAGCDEAKQELEEIVDFLKNPKRYTDIGGKIPKGALLVGPPGTGKTLLARAVAGEAKVTFFKMSGSDFVEMFVGVGAARVRDLFQQAREKAPCIIFIDEMDAIGKSRNNSITSNDEREQTLNQLLVEMDGFDATAGLIILAATNRPEILDPALLRPGRFDRQVTVDQPDRKGREQILKIHTKNIKMDDSVDLTKIAAGTPGFVGADLANIANEAALMAVRAGRTRVSHADFDEAIEKHALGIAKKSRSMLTHERENTAYHEMGHALMQVLSPTNSNLRKITIVPRGRALGVMWSSPQEGIYSHSTQEFIAKIDIALGGRAAEEIIFGHITTGASSDIKSATAIARSMIMDYGMSERFKNVSFGDTGYDKKYSESTQEYIDSEIARILKERYARVITTLTKYKDLLRDLALRILETENMSDDEFFAIFNQNPQAKAEREAMLQANPYLSSEKYQESVKKPENKAEEASQADMPNPEKARSNTENTTPEQGENHGEND